jgi:hypothetical protein
LYFTFGNADELRSLITHHLPPIVANVEKRLRSSRELDGLEDEVRSTREHSGQRLQELAQTAQNPSDTSQRVTVFDETNPPVPNYDGKPQSFTHAYQTWVVRPRQSLRLRLDRMVEDSVKNAIETHFKSMVPGNFYPPIVTADSHVVRWQSRISGGRGPLTYVRYVEVNSEGALRYSEKVDRHETRQESVSDLFIASLQFWGLVLDFYQTRGYSGSLSVLHRIDCVEDVQFFATFPDARGVYYQTDSITFPEGRDHGIAKSSSRNVREVILFEKPGDRQEIVVDSILTHLRELCQASVDYDQLSTVIAGLPGRAALPPH